VHHLRGPLHQVGVSQVGLSVHFLCRTLIDSWLYSFLSAFLVTRPLRQVKFPKEIHYTYYMNIPKEGIWFRLTVDDVLNELLNSQYYKLVGKEES
jgi:hypothetical protein